MSKKRSLRFPYRATGQILDSSMDTMEENRFRKQNQRLILSLSKKLPLTYHELECLLLMYYKLQKESKDFKFGVDKSQFRRVLHCSLDMTDDYIMDRIFISLDKSTSSYITMETWANSFALFLRGTLEEQIKYCFSVYESIGEKMINRDTMFQLLRKSLLSLSGTEEAEEIVKQFKSGTSYVCTIGGSNSKFLSG